MQVHRHSCQVTLFIISIHGAGRARLDFSSQVQGFEIEKEKKEQIDPALVKQMLTSESNQIKNERLNTINSSLHSIVPT